MKENISPNSWGSFAVEPLLAHLQRVTAAREPSRALCYFGRQRAAELVPAAAPPAVPRLSRALTARETAGLGYSLSVL